MRVVYVNGDYLPEDKAKLSVFDRGYLFGDAVYEVTAVLEGRLIDFSRHMARLARSLGELDMAMPMEEKGFLAIHRKLIDMNSLKEGVVYLQVSRGTADRDFVFAPGMGPQNVVLFTQQKSLEKTAVAEKGLAILTAPDMRWARRDIKTTQLLYSSLMKSRALAKGAGDIWFEEGGFITEGTSSNAFIITPEGEVLTRPASSAILHGITREAVLECARFCKLRFSERAFSIARAETASEAFATSASGFVMPVVSINGHQIGDGAPGRFTTMLRSKYIAKARQGAV